MHGHTIDAGTVHHNCQSSGLHGSLEGLEALFEQFIIGNISGCAVLARAGESVAQIVFGARSDIARADMVGIITLEAEKFLAASCKNWLRIDIMD